jgi:threonine synthase
VVIAITGNGLKTQEAIQGALGQALEIAPQLKSFEEKVLAEASR